MRQRRWDARVWLVTGLRLFVVLVPAIVLALPWLRQWYDWWLLRWVDAALSIQCHRIPERTWKIAGTYMAVCSRCTGFYLGFGLGAALLRPKWPDRWVLTWSMASLAVLAVEVVAEFVGVLGVWHPLRTATGLAVTWPITALAFRRLRLWAQRRRRHRWA